MNGKNERKKKGEIRKIASGRSEGTRKIATDKRRRKGKNARGAKRTRSDEKEKDWIKNDKRRIGKNEKKENAKKRRGRRMNLGRRRGERRNVSIARGENGKRGNGRSGGNARSAKEPPAM